MLKKLNTVKNNYGYIVLESYVAFIIFGSIAITLLYLSVFLQKQVHVREQRLESYRFAYEISEEIKNNKENRLKEKNYDKKRLTAELRTSNESLYIITIIGEEQEIKIELLSTEK